MTALALPMIAEIQRRLTFSILDIPGDGVGVLGVGLNVEESGQVRHGLQLQLDHLSGHCVN